MQVGQGTRRAGGVGGVVAAMSAAVVAMLAGEAAGQWTVINLHPVTAASSEARSVSEAQQAGVSGLTGALLWHGSGGSARPLNPAPGQTAAANGVFVGQQGGSVSVGAGVDQRTHAALWSSTAASMVDLHPGAAIAVHSMIAAIDGTTQVGSFLAPDTGGTFSTGRPCMWLGTAGSFVDLTPVGFQTGEVRGTFGGQQVGGTFDNFFGTACMWSGSAASFTNLQPDEALFSVAECTDGINQYGVIGILEPVPGLFPVRWSGTAESWVLLDIPTDRWGEVHATHGGYQVGYITDTDGISNSRACIWTAGPGSYADLHPFLPATLTESNAKGIWRHAASGTTYVVGYGHNAGLNRREAIMWVHGPGVNLIVSPEAPADDVVGVGEPIAFTVRVLNAGADSATDATLIVNLPASSIATFAGATPAPTAVTPTQLTFNIGALANFGGAADVSITLTAQGGGLATINAAGAATGEADPTNNTASASVTVDAPSCPADFNASGSVTVQDIFDFLAAYFGGNLAADFNQSGAISVQDIFDFLAAYFVGCP